MYYLQHLHGYHYVLFGYALFNVLVILIKWSFLTKALSEQGEPSSKRVGAFLLLHVLAFCELYDTLVNRRFDTTHMLYLLVTIGLCWGIATIPQILSLVRGGNAPAEPKEPTE